MSGSSVYWKSESDPNHKVRVKIDWEGDIYVSTCPEIDSVALSAADAKAMGKHLIECAERQEALALEMAPRLLEELQLCVGAIKGICHVRGVPLPNSTLNRAIAAIAKAQGRKLE